MSAPSVLLRPWRDDDLAPFTQMNADPAVMEFFPRPLTADESRAMFRRLRTGIEERGWGLWAVEAEGAFAGFTGLAQPRFCAHFMPAIEIGWRLRRACWGRGIGFAAARQAEAYAFERLQLDELVSFTAAINHRSRRLMERLGFTRQPVDDFPHPAIDAESPVKLHVLYRRGRAAFRAAAAS